MVSVSVAGLVTLAAMTQPSLAPEAKTSLLQYVTGKYLLPSNCTVTFEWDEPAVVGETVTFTVRVSCLSISIVLLLVIVQIKVSTYNLICFPVLSTEWPTLPYL